MIRTRQNWRQKPPLGVPINWGHPLANGLVGCWLFNEGSGDKVYDLSGNGHTGTLTDTVPSVWQPGNDGPVLNLDGSDDCVTVGPWDPSAGDLTMIVGLKPTTDLIQTIVSKRDAWSDADARWQWLIIDSPPRLQWQSRTENQLIAAPISLNTYCRLGLIHRYGVSTEFFKDTVSLGSTGAIAYTGLATIPLRIGSLNAAGYFWGGWMDFCYIYNVAKAAQAVCQIQAQPYAMFGWQRVWALGAPAAGIFTPPTVSRIFQSPIFGGQVVGA